MATKSIFFNNYSVTTKKEEFVIDDVITIDNVSKNAKIVKSLFDDVMNGEKNKFTKCMEYANKIMEYTNTLDNIKLMNIKEDIIHIYCIAAELLINSVGLHMNRKTFNKIELNSINLSITYLQKVLNIDPAYSRAIMLYRTIHTFLAFFTEKFKDKLEILSKVCIINPYDYELQYNIGLVYQMTNNIPKAIEHMKMALSIIEAQLANMKERNQEIMEHIENVHLRCLIGLGTIYIDHLEFILADYYMSKAFEMKSSDIEVNNQFGMLYAHVKCIDKSIYHYKYAIDLQLKKMINNENNDNEKKILSNLYTNLGNAYAQECNFDLALEHFDKALSYIHDNRAAFQNKLLYANNLAYTYEDPMEIFNMHKKFEQFFPRIVMKHSEKYIVNDIICTWDGKDKRELFAKTRLNIGFVSADFFGHVVHFFLQGIFKYIDYQLFNVTCYSSKTYIEQDVFPNITWKIIKDMDVEDVKTIIEDDKIDILIDLSGCTSGSRLDVFALKPAPIQITYCGYPNTTGLSNIDYRIVDKYCDSDGVSPGPGNIVRPSTQKYHTEKLLFMNKCFLTFTYLPDIPPVVKQPVIRNGYLTIGSFNRYNKYNEKLINVWKKIMERCPTVRLIIKTKEFTTESVREKFLSMWDADILNRITLLPYNESYVEHYNDYNRMDIALDTFPYSGTTTSCEALCMGVPVLTLFDSERQYHAQNVTASLMMNSGLSEFICYSEEEYIEKIEYYANNIDKLCDIKENVRDNFIKNVCNHREFVNELEDKLLQIYREHDFTL